MSYLLDKKVKRKRFVSTGLFVVVFLVVFYFRLGIWNGLSSVASVIFHPVLVLGNSFGGTWGGVKSYFMSKNSLYRENALLQSKIDENEARLSNYNAIVADDINLKEILGRKNTKATFVLGAILAKPNQSAYDTLLVDAGGAQGLSVGNTVFALGNVPIGRVAEVHETSSKVILFSNPGEKTHAVLARPARLNDVSRSGGNIFIEIVGRGGGNFEMIIPEDVEISKGDHVVSPGITPYVLATVETTISDPRDPFNKALLVSPVNIQEIKFVQVEVR